MHPHTPLSRGFALLASRLCLALSVALTPSLGGARLHAQEISPRPSIDLIPQEPSDYAQGVSGHFGFFASPEWLIIGGGCNFPDVPVAQGGKKRYYAEIYLQHRPAGEPETTTDWAPGAWRLQASLPTPLAYAHTAEGAGQLYLYGGETPQGDSDLIHTLSYDTSKQRLSLSTSTLRLPTPRATGATVRYIHQPQANATPSSRQQPLIDDYLIGGRKAGQLTTSMLRVRHLAPGKMQIEEMPPYPGEPLLKVVAWQSEGYIYLLGSVAGSQRNTPSATLSLSGYRYDIKSARWSPLPLPASSFYGATFGGGSVIEIEGRPLLLGGVHAEVFLPAIQRAQAIRRAEALGQADTLAQLRADSKAYLEMPAEAFRFNATPWSYIARTGAWRRGHSAPLLAVADALCLKVWNAERETYIIYIIAGETKAGIRTPRIYSVALSELWPSGVGKPWGRD